MNYVLWKMLSVNLKLLSTLQTNSVLLNMTTPYKKKWSLKKKSLRKKYQSKEKRVKKKLKKKLRRKKAKKRK